MFLVYDKQMNPIEFPRGAKPLDIFISSIEKERVSDRVEGSNRKINYGSTYNDRDINLEVLLNAHDTQDYRLLRNAIYAMFQQDDEIYVSEEYERGKRYLVSVDERFIPERIKGNRRFATASINCSLLKLSFAESIGTSQDIHQNGIDANSELWGFGMGLIADDESLIYTHTGTSFKIWNAGNVPIHPFEQDLTIEISGVDGTGFELTNDTTGDIFQFKEALTTSDVVKIDGPNITINDLQAFRDTNRKYITLVPGWNEFTTNMEATVKYDFRFYYR